MKKQDKIYTIAILFLLCVIAAFGQCPPQGDSKNVKLQALDTLKNRNYVSQKIIELSIDSIFKPSNDVARFNSNMYVHIVGFVYDVKPGGSETCNCHSKDKDQLDIHIEIVRDLNNVTRANKMIVEVNRFTKLTAGMDYLTVHNLIGKKVDIYGWMFADEEHKQNATNTNPNGTNLWRQTIWEVHPVMNIKEAK